MTTTANPSEPGTAVVPWSLHGAQPSSDDPTSIGELTAAPVKRRGPTWEQRVLVGSISGVLEPAPTAPKPVEWSERIDLAREASEALEIRGVPRTSGQYAAAAAVVFGDVLPDDATLDEMRAYLRDGTVPVRHTATPDVRVDALREQIDAIAESFDVGIEDFMAAKRQEWAQQGTSARLSAEPAPTDLEDRAWLLYRDHALAHGVQARSLRRREFVAGYRAAAEIAGQGFAP